MLYEEIKPFAMEDDAPEDAGEEEETPVEEAGTAGNETEENEAGDEI